MRKYIKILFVLSTMFFFIHVNDVNVFAETNTNQNYERDYLSKVYNSENGLEGTTARLRMDFCGWAAIPDFTDMTGQNSKNI